MSDVLSPESRSKNMRAIRGKNTHPELLLRKLLFGRGFRFRLHVKTMPGKPDIVLPKYLVAILVHGCFWHGHECYLFKLPISRRDFWRTKIAQNRMRDIRDTDALLQSGWRVLCVWECALKGKLRWDHDELCDQISRWILCGGEHEKYSEIQCLSERKNIF